MSDTSSRSKVPYPWILQYRRLYCLKFKQAKLHGITALDSLNLILFSLNLDQRWNKDFYP